QPVIVDHVNADAFAPVMLKVTLAGTLPVFVIVTGIGLAVVATSVFGKLTDASDGTRVLTPAVQPSIATLLPATSESLMKVSIAVCMSFAAAVPGGLHLMSMFAVFVIDNA